RKAAGPRDRGNVVRESQLVINNDPEVSCCLGWNKTQGVNIDADVVVDGLFGWEDHQFRFGQVQLKVVIFHPCGYISETVRNPRRDRGVLRRERQKQMSISGITGVGKTMRVDDRAQRGGVNGKEKWSHHRALGHPSGEAVRYRQLTLP